MTDRDSERIDLRALEIGPAATDRTVAAAMARIATTPQLPRPTMEGTAARFVRPALVAATVLVAAAVVAITFVDARRDTASLPAAVVASWADESHVPTNAELLLAFQGYAR